MTDPAIWVAAFACVGVIVGPYLAYVTARRRFAGTVATTDADGLWKEATDLRKQYQLDITDLRGRLERDRLEHARERVELLDEIHSLRSEVRAKDDRIEHLESENLKLTARVSELEGELKRRLEAAHTAAATLTDGGGS